LPGKALHVGLAIWRWSGIKKSRKVQVSLSAIAVEFNVGRATATRGLTSLVKAGLVAVEHRPGRRAIVTIVDQTESGSGNAAASPLRVPAERTEETDHDDREQPHADRSASAQAPTARA
jgi:DNA-binding MarR family transcriptional regulator